MKAGILKEGTLKYGKGDEREERDIEVRKKIKQKEDMKEERREEIRKKAGWPPQRCKSMSGKKEDVSQGECTDTSRATWICERCRTVKFCMECADRNPEGSIHEIASASSDSPAYWRKAEEEETESYRKRIAQEGNIIEEEMEGRVKSRHMEE